MVPTPRRWLHLPFILLLLLTAIATVPAPTRAQEFDVQYVVDNTGDADTAEGGTFCTAAANDCTLRQAIETANKQAPGTRILITFATALNNQTINISNPTGPLPAITIGNTEIRGPSFGVPLIAVNGLGKAVGFHLASDNNTISGLSIYGFSDTGTEPFLGSGIYISGSNNKVVGNFIGITRQGVQPEAGLRNFSGVRIAGGTGNVIGGVTPNFGSANYISGNTQNGVLLNNANANFVQGNFIGVVRTGLTTVDVLGNGQFGVQIFSTGNGSSSQNLIGGTNPNAANIIAGNGRAGIRLAGTNTMTNTIQGNFIGTDNFGNPRPPAPPPPPPDPDPDPDPDPQPDYRNLGDGILIEGGAKNNIVSGIPSAPMLISNNTGNGIVIRGAGTTGNEIRGVTIGTGLNGTEVDLGNQQSGIRIDVGASDNRITGTPAARTLIVGNRNHGIVIDGLNTRNNAIAGVHIGVGPDPAVTNGTVTLPNQGDGIRIFRAPETRIESGNLIAGNTAYGIRVTSAVSTTILGSIIGLDVVGTASVPNGTGGVRIDGTSQRTLIGGGDLKDAARRNVISGNNGPGIDIVGTSVITVTGNIIGLRKNSAGANEPFIVAAPNTGDGLRADNTTTLMIGGPAPAQGNWIAQNGGHGISLTGTGSSTIRSNHIGVIPDPSDAQGVRLLPRGNALDGLNLSNTATSTVESNLIAFNRRGIVLSQALETLIQFNQVNQNTQHGIALIDSANTTVSVNVINQNTQHGIDLTGSVNTTIQSNSSIMRNGGNGIYVHGNTSAALISRNNIYTNTLGILVQGSDELSPQRIRMIDNSISGNTAGVERGGIRLEPATAPGMNANPKHPNHGIAPPLVDATAWGLPRNLGMRLSREGVLSGYVLTNTGGLPPFTTAACVTCTVQIFAPNPALPVPDGQGFRKLVEDDPVVDETGFFSVKLPEIPRQILLTATDFAGNTSEYAIFRIIRAVQIAPSRPDEPEWIAPTESYAYRHTVTNTGTIEDEFRLAYWSSLGWTARLEPSGAFIVPAQASFPVTVTLQAPAGPASNVQLNLPHTLAITVANTLDERLSDAVRNTTRVTESIKLAIEPPGSSGLTLPGQPAEYVHTIRNNGNTTATITLAFTATQSRWSTTLDKTGMVLAPGQSEQIRLRVTPPPQALANERSEARITVQVEEDERQNTQIVNTTTVTLQAKAKLEPNRQGTALAGQTIAFRHTATNQSNGTATFKIVAQSSLGSTVRFRSDTPGVDLTGENTFAIGFEAPRNQFHFYADITVNPAARPGQRDTVAIYLTDDQDRVIGGASVTNTITVEGDVPVPVDDRRVYLPIIRR